VKTKNYDMDSAFLMVSINTPAICSVFWKEFTSQCCDVWVDSTYAWQSSNRAALYRFLLILQFPDNAIAPFNEHLISIYADQKSTHINKFIIPWVM